MMADTKPGVVHTLLNVVFIDSQAFSASPVFSAAFLTAVSEAARRLRASSRSRRVSGKRALSCSNSLVHFSC